MRPSKHPDLHGSAPESADTALLIIDVISDFRFPGAEQFERRALRAAKCIAALKARLKKSGVPVLYVNDNVGKWRSDSSYLIEHASSYGTEASRKIASLLRPQKDDYFILKPKHSAFYATPLETLLTYMRAKRLILTGWTTNLCILFTANDAYLREYQLFIPKDCVTAQSASENRYALSHCKTWLDANLSPSTSLSPARLAKLGS